MPAGIFVPAQLNDLAVDVALTSPARGDLFYRGASKWNNLPAGTSGQFLKTQGPGGDPVWSGLSASDLAPAVILAPTTSGRNVVQGNAVGVTPLALRQFSAFQSANLLELQDPAGVTIGAIGPAARFFAPDGTAAAPSLTFLNGAGAGLYRIGTNILGIATSGAERIRVDASGFVNIGGVIANTHLTVCCALATNVGFLVQGAASQSADLLIAQDNNGNLLARIANTGVFVSRPAAPGLGDRFIVQNVNGDVIWNLAENANTFWIAAPSDSVTTLRNSPSFTLRSTFWNGSSSVAESFSIVNIRSAASANSCNFHFRDNSGAAVLALANSGGQAAVGFSSPTSATLNRGQLYVTSLATTTPTLGLRAIASQSADLLQAQDSGANTNASISNIGAGVFRPRDAATNTITTGLTVGHNSSGTPATAFGTQIQYQLKSSTTENRAAAELSVEWVTATDASRAARVKLNVYDTAVRECLRLEASGTAAMIGFLGAGAVVRQTLSAAATDPATTQTLANSLRSALINFGLAA